MQLEYFESDELDRETTDKLWAAGVCMDDWDFLLISRDLDRFEEIEQTDDWEPNKKSKVWTAKGWYLNRILESCGNYTYEWYRVQWEGKPAMIGVTYHS